MHRMPGRHGFAVLRPQGRLARIAPASGAATRFAYDGDRIVAEYNDAGTVLRRYLPGPGVDETLIWYEGSSFTDRRWLHQDERGSVSAISKLPVGGFLGANTYDPYGTPAAANQGLFQYTGQAYIAALGLYYYKARFYDPKLQRFIAPDPIGYAGGVNLYAYGGGDPIGLRDPLGLFNCSMRATRIGGCNVGGVIYDYATYETKAGEKGFIGGHIRYSAAAIFAHSNVAGLVHSVSTNGRNPDSIDQSWRGHNNPSEPERGLLGRLLGSASGFLSGILIANEMFGGIGGEYDWLPDVTQFLDPTNPPTGWEWRGRGAPGTREGAWYNPTTRESLHDDRSHPTGKAPHWTYTSPTGMRFDNFGNGWVPQ